MSLITWKKLQKVWQMSDPGRCIFLKKKMMETCNKISTRQIAAYVAKMQEISLYLALNVTFEYITDAHSDRHTNFTILLKRKENTHVLIARQQA